MKINQISAQGKKTLLEFYTPNERQSEGVHATLNGMHRLLRHLETVEGPEMYAYTSIFRLNFVNGDDYRLPTIALIVPSYEPSDQDGYVPVFHIGYPPTADVAGSEEDWIQSTTTDVEEAGDLLLRAIRLSAFTPVTER